MTERDIVSDIVHRLAESLGADVVPRDLLQSIERDVRRDWAGDVYIAAAKGKGRDMDILDKYRRGMPVPRLAASYGLTERRIRQIVNRKK